MEKVRIILIKNHDYHLYMYNKGETSLTPEHLVAIVPNFRGGYAQKFAKETAKHCGLSHYQFRDELGVTIKEYV